MGFRIFLHSVRLVFNQLNGAMRISGVLYLAALVISGIGMFFQPTAVAGQPPTLSWQFLLATIISSLLYLWIAVGWHRFVLLDELPDGPVPAFHKNRLLAYFGRGIQAGLIMMVAALALFVIITMLLLATGASPIVAFFAFLVAVAIFLLISYRLAPMFPSAAIGQSVGVSQAWAATSGASGVIMGLAVVSAIAAVVIDLPAQLFIRLPGGAAWLGFIWLGITGWVKLMVGVSILTTLYGVYVEKRSIA